MCVCNIYEKNGSAGTSKNLDGYKSENNLIGTSK